MVYDVMLVDDDYPMLKFLERVLPWEEHGLRLAGSALTSQKALELFKEKNPQIVISDIGLPHMDGIELTAEMKRLKPELRVIFLTCHEDFHYARKAIGVGADDYLIKDELTPEKLSDSLNKSVVLLSETVKQKELLEKRVEVQRNKDVLKQSFMNRIKSGETSDSVRQLGLRIGIDWNKPQFIAGILRMDYASFIRQYALKDLKLIRYALSNIMDDFAEAKEGLSVIGGEDGDIGIVYNFENNLALNAHGRLADFIRQVGEAAKNYIRIEIRFVISRSFQGMETIGPMFGKLRTFRQGCYYERKPDAVMREYKELPWQEAAYFALQAKTEWMDAFARVDAAGLKDILRRIAHEAAEAKADPAKWLGDCSQFIRMLEFESRYSRDSDLFHQCLLRSGDLNETIELAVGRIEQIMDSMTEEAMAFSKTPKLQVIESYVRSHLSENISSVSMANYLFLNPSYFSRYFKKLTGMNYTDYVHRLKMGIAAQMMKNKEATIEVISGRLGYSDRTYFSKVFKKYVGVSPSDYK
ncbi:response regulator [Paenibacillus sp. LHD-117]|uniref:response regulator transcription factor n=1 Tax=Paenibacillus sp. LHD-117 TaxID=3071412 RepID=UPI0027DEDF90|nr:response regulator [Paenibacillus sp. LHD-117]MDQ6422674.1 response regulator [Paenibacillus sp. LHD-117]